MAEDGYPKTADELIEAARDALPHGKFRIRPGVILGTPFLTAVCRCGRAHPFLGDLGDDLLIRWLADHDDEAFLTAEQQRARDEATVAMLPTGDDAPLLVVEPVEPHVQLGQVGMLRNL
jgi:hypothetical protein